MRHCPKGGMHAHSPHERTHGRVNAPDLAIRRGVDADVLGCVAAAPGKEDT